MVRMGVISLLLASVAALARPVQVPITGGVVQGTELPDGSTLFYGIPYAAPPTGDFRWKPPQPVPSWSGVRDATQPHPCIQHDEGWNSRDAHQGQEDCLYLSVHAPRHPANARLPVIFWIHGGSNRAGSGYGFADSAIYRRGVVIVALEYRLGVFGFLSLPELTRESPHHSSGNYAILDQIAALEWVRHNIAAFGGDPDNVTIAGQSAGAFNVGMLLLSPPARGLFHRAIMQSGTPGLGLPPRPLEENEAIGLQLMTLMQRPRGTEGLAALRRDPATALIGPGDQLVPRSGLDPSVLWGQAIVDGWVLAQPPAEALAAGQQAHVPLIIGNNTREFSLGGGPDSARAVMKGVLGTHASDVMAAYGLTDTQAPADDPVLGDVGTQFLTDFIFRCPANDLARFHTNAGVAVWRYQFGVAAPDARGVVGHSSELKYVFDAPPAGATSGDWPPIQQYWAQFAKTGNPNGAGLPRWPGMGNPADYLEFTPQGPKLGQDLRGVICRQIRRTLSGN